MENDLIGRRLGPYEIIELLDRGGMAEVYRGYHYELDRVVAIKIVGRHLQDDPVFNARFRREARAIARLSHPNIVRLYDFGAAEGGHYMVMEYIEGVTLDRLLAEVRSGQRTLHPEDIIFFMRQIAAALDHAHSKGVIHRDVKPANILITRSGQAILTDFGLALLRSRAAEDQSSGTAFGTPEYMAPEQIADSRAVSPASDIYSLGVILYEILTGELPFEADSPIDMALRHLHESAPDPRYLNPSIPPSVAQVVLRAMAKQPKERFTTAMQMAIALEWAYDHPTEQLPPLPSSGTQTGDSGQARQSAAAPTARHGPLTAEERREKRRLEAAHRQLKREEARKRKLLLQAIEAEKRRERQLARERARMARRERRRRFLAAWSRTILVLVVLSILLAAAIYLLHTAGIISIVVRLPITPAAGPTEALQAAVEIEPSLTPSPTPTIPPSPTPIPTATPLQPVPVNTVPPVEFTPLVAGSSAFRLHDGQVLQFVPAGQFLMGTDDPNRNRADRPQHAVMLSDYWIDRTEITNAQYRLCVEEGRCAAPVNQTYYDNPEYANYPVTFVRYEDAVAYCLWIAGKTGLVTGLPTEAQWEKAAAWDPVNETARLYPWGNDRPTPDLLRFNESITSKPAAPVGSYPAGASAYGVLDMAGNVWEWVADWFDPDYYNRTGISRDPTGPLSGTQRITRGGSWTRDGRLALSSLRNPTNPAAYSNEIGFRCAMSVGRPAPQSGILLAPLDLIQVLLEQLDQARSDPSNNGAVLDEWMQRLEALRLSLQSGERQNGLTLVEERLSRLPDQRATGLLAGRLAFQLESSLRWIEDQLLAGE